MLEDDEIIKFLKHVFNENFPNFSIDELFQVNGITQYGTISNSSFEGTKFHYDFKNKKLLHFTSLNNLKSILESESLKISNFNKFDDKMEMLLAAEEIFHISDLEKRKAKQGLFALSLTELQEEKKVKDNYEDHWRVYGNNYRGVALELEINHYKAGYYPLSVQYIKNIEDIHVIEKLKELLPKYFSNYSFNENLVCFLYPLLCVFKVNELVPEKEVRVFYHDFNLKDNIPYPEPKDMDSTQFYISSNNEPVYYRNVPLSFPEPKNENNTTLITLHKIHIGKKALNCNEEYNTTAEMVGILKNLCDKKNIDFSY